MNAVTCHSPARDSAISDAIRADIEAMIDIVDEIYKAGGMDLALTSIKSAGYQLQGYGSPAGGRTGGLAEIAMHIKTMRPGASHTEIFDEVRMEFARRRRAELLEKGWIV